MQLVSIFILCLGILGNVSSMQQVVTVQDVLDLDPSTLSPPVSLRDVEDDVDVWLWTRSNPSVPFDVSEGMDNMQGVFDPRKKTYVLMHGWGDYEGYIKHIVPELLVHEDCNVLTVDWHKLCPFHNYLSSVWNTVPVGEHVGRYLTQLIENHGLSHEDVHIIGFSLGAHGAGHSGRTILKLTGSKIARITGLDPARPIWDMLPEERRLQKDDADFVDILHTNSGLLIRGELSFFEPMGHVDFYPNGGQRQPGCLDVCIFNCEDGNLLEIFGQCSHVRSNKYMGESVTGATPFMGLECPSWEDFLEGNCDSGDVAIFHVDVPQEMRGTFFFHVHGDEPFAAGNPLATTQNA